MRYPSAAWKPVPSHSGAMTEDLGLVLHVTTNDGDPYNFFDNTGNQASSHFWISETGAVEQYVECGTKAWAQAAGNADYHSVETSGRPDEAMEPAEVEALAHLYAWGHKELGWKLQLADKPGEPGFGWHGMGGAEWGGHTGCPGDKRKAQRQEVLNRAAELLHEQATAAPKPAPAPAKPEGEVQRLQHDVHQNPDGNWGPITDRALTTVRAAAQNHQVNVRELQGYVGAHVDGVDGPETQAHLENTVREIQTDLGVASDGKWGTKTDAAFWHARSEYHR